MTKLTKQEVIRGLESFIQTELIQAAISYLEQSEVMGEDKLVNRVAQCIAHRACCGSEHNPQEGKLHGYCVVCGVPWPCEYVGEKPLAKDIERRVGK